MIALRAEHEIAIHTKGALNNGVTPEELMAILIHSSAYAGAPAAVSAEKVIRKTLEDSGNIS
jgi:4-carboxymuconolactone decarboxylase